MMMKKLLLGCLVLTVAGTIASAGTIISQDDGTRFGTVEWSLDTTDADCPLLIFVLTNDTQVTKSAADAFTGFSFSLVSGKVDSLYDVTGSLIEVGSGGVVTAKSGTPNNWGLGAGTDYDAVDDTVENLVHFTAGGVSGSMHAILGELDSNGKYGEANPSITQTNDGKSHNPFTYLTATLKIKLDKDTLNAAKFGLADANMFFGTDLQVNLVPLPSGAWAGLALLGGIGMIQIVRRRRRASAI